MRHIKLESCESIQIYLKTLLESKNEPLPILTSTIKQTKGIGRGQNTWDNLPNALAFSFAFQAPEPILVPIQFGAYIAQWILQHEKVNVKVKWPNDLFFHGKKIGGIICHLLGQNTAIVGVGINWGNAGNTGPWTELFSQKTLSKEMQHAIPMAMVREFLNVDISPLEIVEQWKNFCCHLNSQVQIDDESGSHRGIFRGITSQGMARVEINHDEKIFVNGHLTVLDKLL
jgi:BirA family biotin operon repressor/biotin-[acetyl-CoA-carboxylase] ligase